ncbi:ThiF family adenylyltransferase [Hymenobacter rigui]|uniref:Thiamine biosynthesis protein ThiF n=1 Tax=Hymenobacter rigui TaxID=334424 RepID=A0A3R9MGT5_9BACT|nr:ThiF family adenylyltransferase [Hymenobacter rigui]RSK45539.1 hypothetical protein EI291_18270 [Hymenobacter rigui]
MSKWFERHVQILLRESSQLANNSSYRERSQQVGALFVSAGEIIVRLNGTQYFPVAIVYADATPYALPWVYMLNDVLSEDEAKSLAAMSYGEASAFLQPKAKFYYKRHQNHDGNLCLLEQDNLDKAGPETFDANAVIARVRQWLTALLTGAAIPEGTEVELFSHYRLRAPIHVLLTEPFYEVSAGKGIFYLALLLTHVLKRDVLPYVGAYLVNQADSGLFLDDAQQQLPFMPKGLRTPLELVQNESLAKELLETPKLAKGYWWSLQAEPEVYANTDELLTALGTGDLQAGIALAEAALWEELKVNAKYCYIGLRYSNRRGETEWAMLMLIRTRNDHVPLYTSPNVRDLLQNYDVHAVQTEPFTEQQYHLRNSGRVEHAVVREQAVTVLGCGALGGEIADALAKAGVGHIHLVDNQKLFVHNSVRHLAGYEYALRAKVDAVRDILRDHNRFVELNTSGRNILQNELPAYFHAEGIGISSVADDNTEAFLNEQALAHGRTVFYARALRGGKAARIFRVVPGQDACFNCLTLYRADKHADFIDVPEDELLPTLRNECNNPIRPASAADLKLVSALTSRLLLDHLQAEVKVTTNHWVWVSEALPGSKMEATAPFSVLARSMSPHPNCPYCNALRPVQVTIEPAALAFMRNLTLQTAGIETGGVLVGQVGDTGTIHIQHASGPGPNAVRTATRFERDVAFCQGFVDAHTAEGRPYVGEWHSHPNEDNKPSQTDLTSLGMIALQPQYLTTKPIMVIFSRSGVPSCSIHPASAAYYFVTLDELATNA